MSEIIASSQENPSPQIIPAGDTPKSNRREPFMNEHRYNMLSEMMNRGQELEPALGKRIILEFRKLEESYAKLQREYDEQAQQIMQIRMDSADVESLRAEIEGLKADRIRLIHRLTGGVTVEEAKQRLEMSAAIQGQVPPSQSTRPQPLPEPEKPKGLLERIISAVCE